MRVKSSYTIPLDRLDAKRFSDVGNGAKSLYNLEQLNINIPFTFFLTYQAFDVFVQNNELGEFILQRLLKVDVNKHKELEKTAESIRNKIKGSDIPSEIKEEIRKEYSKLSGFTTSFVSVFASPLSPDLDNATYGEKPVMLFNIKGEEQLFDAIKEIWASIFSAKAIFYREAKKYHGILSSAVVVQRMLFAEASGVLFTVDPIDEDDSKVQIEAIHGLSEPLFNNEITPDIYIFDKKQSLIVEKNIISQEWMLVRKGKSDKRDPTIKVDISSSWKKSQKLDDKHIKYLGELAVLLEKFNAEPKEIDWALESGKIYITNLKPITKLSIGENDWKISPTAAALKAKLEHDDEIEPLENTQSKEEDLVEKVVGDMRDEDIIETVNPLGKESSNKQGPRKEDSSNKQGSRMEEPSNKQGSRMEDSSNKQGSRMEEPSNEQGSRKEDSSNKQDTSTQDKISTAMKVYYEIDNAESNLKMSDDFDGIGIFDPEKFRGDMVEANLQKAASKTHGPVLFKLSGKSVSDKETLKREVKYIKNVRNKKHKRNVCLLLPPIDDDEMIAKLKREIVALGLRRSASFKIYLTLSTPGSVLRINDMIKHGVDGVVISFRELATLITARKPEQISNELLAKDTSVERIISESVKDANGEKIDTVISFGKDNLSDNVLERLVKMGVDAVSVQSEDGSDLKSRIHKIEAERILKHKR